jgi:hypothetical protein
LVEQRIENPRVGSSILPQATKNNNEIKELTKVKSFFSAQTTKVVCTVVFYPAIFVELMQG